MKNLIGKKFNKLTVLKLGDKEKNGHIHLICKCDCGEIKSIRKTKVINGETKSCGCYQGWNLKKYTKHGYAKHPLYTVYKNMMSRCYDPKNDNYKNYGARGIQVCEEWRNNIDSFFNWAETNGYEKNLTIDRINNSKGYYPENCKWSTPREQANNRRTNHYETYKNEKHTIAEWSRILDIDPDLLYSRLSKGWSFERAIKTPHIKGRGNYQKGTYGK